MEHLSFSFILNIIKFLFTPVIKIFNWIYNKLPFKITDKKRLPPLGIIESSWQNHFWAFAKNGDEDVILINTYWHVTNTLPYNLTALNVFLTKPQHVKGNILVRDPESNYYGSYGIRKGYTTDAHIIFIMDKKFIKHEQKSIKIDFDIQDALGRIHKVRDVIIHPAPKGIVPKRDTLITENPSQITNTTLKQVIAILKNEVQQYKVLGRKEGRLGTVEWPRGQLEWRATGEKIKFLFEQSKEENVTSEHINALKKLYTRSTKSQQKLIKVSLVDRIDKNREYRDIGYLIFFFFFETHNIEECLAFFLEKLQGDNSNAFSDVLRVIDILLAFRYSEFSEKELDEIENFVYSTTVDSFHIKERISAIRVRNILNKEK